MYNINSYNLIKCNDEESRGVEFYRDPAAAEKPENLTRTVVTSEQASEMRKLSRNARGAALR